MTKWSEFPLRPQGQPWPGLNTRGGRLDPGAGYLEDGSFNAVINEADVLSKRKGLIRGLDERFVGVVCGLFRYTDNCGIEYLVVADQEGIKVRTPFDVPVFLGSDSLPFDDFEELDTTRWAPTAAYEVFLGALQLNGSDVLGTNDFVSAGQLMQWFKPSVLTSYYVEAQYRLQVSTEKQAASVVIKRDVAGTSYLEATVTLRSGEYRLLLSRVSGGTRTLLDSILLDGASLGDGFLRLSYDAGSFRATARVIPSGGEIATITATISEALDAGLGQLSAIGLQRERADVAPQIESVSGGQV